jgi:alkylhydroperoxidase family enzyme
MRRIFTAAASAPRWRGPRRSLALRTNRFQTRSTTRPAKKFNEVESTQLTLAIVAINGWNRFNVAFHTPAGSYKSAIGRKTG